MFENLFGSFTIVYLQSFKDLHFAGRFQLHVGIRDDDLARFFHFDIVDHSTKTKKCKNTRLNITSNNIDIPSFVPHLSYQGIARNNWRGKPTFDRPETGGVVITVGLETELVPVINILQQKGKIVWILLPELLAQSDPRCKVRGG